MLIILVEYCAGSTTSKYSWKSCRGQSRAAGQSCASCWKRWAQSADASPLSPSDYAFLIERFVDRTTLHRAEALAKKCGVLPHAVMIANGWLSASDYYRALAQTCGVPFRDEIGPHEVTAPASLRSPRECLARGLLKERARGGAYVFAPEKLRPNAVEEVLAANRKVLRSDSLNWNQARFTTFLVQGKLRGGARGHIEGELPCSRSKAL